MPPHNAGGVTSLTSVNGLINSDRIVPTQLRGLTLIKYIELEQLIDSFNACILVARL